MKYKRYNLVGVVEDVFEGRGIVWPGNGIMEKNKITTVYDNKITLKDIKSMSID